MTKKNNKTEFSKHLTSLYLNPINKPNPNYIAEEVEDALSDILNQFILYKGYSRNLK